MCGPRVLACINKNKIKYNAKRQQKGHPPKDTRTMSIYNATSGTFYHSQVCWSLFLQSWKLFGHFALAYESQLTPNSLCHKPASLGWKTISTFTTWTLALSNHICCSYMVFGCLLSQPSVEKGIVPAQMGWCHYF